MGRPNPHPSSTSGQSYPVESAASSMVILSTRSQMVSGGDHDQLDEARADARSEHGHASPLARIENALAVGRIATAVDEHGGAHDVDAGLEDLDELVRVRPHRVVDNAVRIEGKQAFDVVRCRDADGVDAAELADISVRPCLATRRNSRSARGQDVPRPLEPTACRRFRWSIAQSLSSSRSRPARRTQSDCRTPFHVRKVSVAERFISRCAIDHAGVVGTGDTLGNDRDAGMAVVQACWTRVGSARTCQRPRPTLSPGCAVRGGRLRRLTRHVAKTALRRRLQSPTVEHKAPRKKRGHQSRRKSPSSTHAG